MLLFTENNSTLQNLKHEDPKLHLLVQSQKWKHQNNIRIWSKLTIMT